MAKRTVDSVVADIASDVSVDWRGVEGNQESVRVFQIMAAVSAARERVSPLPHRGHRLLTAFVTSATTIAALKIAVAIWAALSASIPRFGPAGAVSLLFFAVGTALLATSDRDPRAKALGSFHLLISATFVEPYLRLASSGAVADIASILRPLTPESFLGLALWSFAWTFPGNPSDPKGRRLGSWGLWVGLVLGVTLFAANILTWLRPDAVAAAEVLKRYPGEGLFWPVLFLASIPALPYLLWKSGRGTVEQRSRVTYFVLTIIAGLTPFAVAVILAPAIPALGRPPIQEWVGLGLYLAIVSIVPATAYVVVVRPIINLHFAIRTAVQHRFARRLIWMASLSSVGYVGISLYLGRDRALADLLSEQIGLMSLAAAGLVALVFRNQLLSAVDLWFARGSADYTEVMTRLSSRLGGQRDIRDMHDALQDELLHTLHAARVSIVVINEDRTAYVSFDGKAPPLPSATSIAGFARSTQKGICLAGTSADPCAQMLPSQDRQWLTEVGGEWVFPLRDSSDSLLGMVCLGEGRGPTYSSRDRVLVSAMADQVALRMELSLRRWPGDGGKEQIPASTLVDWQNERAMQCAECDRVFAAGTVACECGRRLAPAALPHVLNGKFKVDRVLGVGGMGIVYLALDTVLQRRVAIKAMPKVTPNYVARLQREARVMAAVPHANLAMIYSAERWRDVPLLIVEYLEGGTLLDGLRAGPMAVDEALDLGIVVADALDRLHASNLLHRDIKPSNIGYTSDGLPKLLDFGLAAVLNGSDDYRDDTDVNGGDTFGRTTTLSEVWAGSQSRTLTQHLVGTPLYLSPEALALDEPEPSFDLWSLSLVLYEVIAGCHPFTGFPTEEVMRRVRSVRVPDVRDFRRDCPPEVAAFLNDALALAKERRPATAAEMRRKLQEVRRAFADFPNLPSRRLYLIRLFWRSTRQRSVPRAEVCMTPAKEIDYILPDCFLALGQAVGTDKSIDFETVVWWRTRYKAAFLHAINEKGNSWALDRRRVTAVGRYLGLQAKTHSADRASIDIAAAEKASAEVEKGCQMNAQREAFADGRTSRLETQTS